MWGIDSERRKLERQLLVVQCKLVDAELKSDINPAVKRWMKDLKAVAYHADDVLDDFRYEALRRDAQIGESTARKGKGSSFDEILLPPQLEMLSIYNCGSLLEIPEVPESLDELVIGECRRLVALPSNLAKLKVLRIQSCDGLKYLPDSLTSLEQLTIERCTVIDKIPQGLLQRLPALKSLKIVGCPYLQRCCGEGGEHFHLVYSIPHKDIPAAETEPDKKKQAFLKRLLPSC